MQGLQGVMVFDIGGVTSCHRCKNGSLSLNTLGQHWVSDKSAGGKVVKGMLDVCEARG